MSSADTDLSSFSIHELAMMHDALDQEVASLTGAINLPRTTNAVSDWLESRMHAAWACMDTIISEARARRPADAAERRHRLVLLTVRALSDVETPRDLEVFAKALAAESAS